MEKFFDTELRGKFGRKRNEVTSRGHVIASQIYENTQSGNDIQTSLDMGLQAFAIERFERGNNRLVSIKNYSKKKKTESRTDVTYVNKDYVYKDQILKDIVNMNSSKK